MEEKMCNMPHLRLSPLPSSNQPDLGTALQNLSDNLVENMLITNFLWLLILKSADPDIVKESETPPKFTFD